MVCYQDVATEMKSIVLWKNQICDETDETEIGLHYMNMKVTSAQLNLLPTLQTCAVRTYSYEICHGHGHYYLQ